MGLGLGLGIWWPIQTSIIPGLLKLLEARADYFENKTCTTNTLDSIAAVRYTPPPPPPPETRFVITVQTDNAGTSADNQFTIPWIGTYDVDWGDGNTDTGVVDTQTHTYATAGTYDVKVTAVTGRIFFQFAGDRRKLIDIKNWGSIIWGNMGGAFNGTLNLLNLSAVDTPDFSQNVSMRGIFSGSNLFRKTNPTTPNLSSWDVSNVSDFAYAFYNGLYPGGKVDFDMSSWNIENMVNGTVFIGGWNTDSLSTANYDSTLISWASQNVNSNVSINFGNAQYTLGGAAEAARNTLINTYGWTITDGGGI